MWAKAIILNNLENTHVQPQWAVIVFIFAMYIATLKKKKNSNCEVKSYGIRNIGAVLTFCHMVSRLVNTS